MLIQIICSICRVSTIVAKLMFVYYLILKSWWMFPLHGYFVCRHVDELSSKQKLWVELHPLLYIAVEELLLDRWLPDNAMDLWENVFY